MRVNISSGSPLETEIGFSRAVRAGPFVSVAGTAPIGTDGSTVAIGDVYSQTRRCIEIAVHAVVEAGAAKEDIVRTRVMLVDIAHWREAARAHGEAFAAIRPACTFMEVSGFIDPDRLVEIEFDCVIGSSVSVAQTASGGRR